MAKEISKEQKKTLLSKYRRNENMNRHTENAVMLINVFWTPSEKAKAGKLKKQIDKQGHITYDQSTWFYEHGHVHYSKLLD